MKKRKITGISLLIIGVAIYMIKIGVFTFFLKPLTNITSFAIFKIQNMNPVYTYSAGVLLVVVGLLLIVFKKAEEKEIKKLKLT